MTTVVSIHVNGKDRTILAEPGQTLLSATRDQMGLTGAGRGCADGSCGTCTLLVDGEPTPSCLVPVVTVDGSAIRTIEGEATEGSLTAVQESFVSNYGTQCGFCTSGMVLTATALLENNPEPSRDDVVTALCGNVCRCTGYESIIQSVLGAVGGSK